jgi:hypothetical protein
MPKQFAFILLICGLVATSACRDSQRGGGDGHSHAPPHGGTPVVVEEHKYHLELVRDATTGLMQAYVLDDHLHDFIKVPETNFTMVANLGGQTERLEFQRVTNAMSPNPTDPSFQFEARADWVKGATNFEGSIPTITLKGQTFTNITFPFPKGTQHTH